MRNMINEVKIEGYLYQFDLQKKTSKAGQDYISGKVSIATDEKCTNIVDVHYTYVVPVFAKSGKPNRTYDFLANLIDHPELSVMGGSIATALKVATSGCNLSLNEWYDQSGNLVSVLRNEGGFIGTTAAFTNKPNFFKATMLVTNVIENDVEDGKDAKTTLKGAIFGYNNALLPVSFVLYGKRGQDFWTGLDISPKAPTLANIWGNIVSNEIKTVKETANAFGDTLVEEEVKIRKEYVIIGGDEPFGFDTEDSIRAAEVEKLTQDRELYLANKKAEREAYQANKTATNGVKVATEEFKF